MSKLVVRKIPFEFDDVAFLWNPEHPEFSTGINFLSFWALGLEKYFIKVMHDAEKQIGCPRVLQEARLFREQEAQHARSHRMHVKELIKRYPGLQETLDLVLETYADLYERRSLDFHLAYVGGLEATFTPVFKMLIDHRETLFATGDPRVASLNLWHFCEEIEHRSSAIMVYDHLVGSHLYRLRVFPVAVVHAYETFRMIEAQFMQHVPEGERHAGRLPTLLHTVRGVGAIEVARSLWGLLAAQMPWHDPEKAALPAWSSTWFEHWDRGDDMTCFYPRPAASTPACPGT